MPIFKKIFICMINTSYRLKVDAAHILCFRNAAVKNLTGGFVMHLLMGSLI